MSKIRYGGTERARYWQGLLARWRGSGLTQAAFCRRHGVNQFTFSGWKGKLAAAGVRMESGSAGKVNGGRPGARRTVGMADCRHHEGQGHGTAGRFVEVQLTQPAASLGYEVVLSRGRVIRVPEQFDPDAVCRLIVAVESSC